jgi:uncharacterized protein (DUF433 family)
VIASRAGEISQEDSDDAEVWVALRLHFDAGMFPFNPPEAGTSEEDRAAWCRSLSAFVPTLSHLNHAPGGTSPGRERVVLEVGDLAPFNGSSVSISVEGPLGDLDIWLDRKIELLVSRPDVSPSAHEILKASSGTSWVLLDGTDPLGILPPLYPGAGVVREAEGMIVSKPGVCGGRPVIAGTRIEPRHLEPYAAQSDISGALEDHPGLTRSEIEAALAYLLKEVSGPAT